MAGQVSEDVERRLTSCNYDTAAFEALEACATPDLPRMRAGFAGPRPNQDLSACASERAREKVNAAARR